MTEDLNTPNPLLTTTVGELENTAQRLAREFDIVLDKTPASGISYKTELEGNNDEVSVYYFKDIHADYARVEVQRQDNKFSIVDCEGSYLVVLNAYGRNLLDALKKKPHKKGVETQLLAGIANKLVTLKRRPEEQQELCADIDKQELDNISRTTIEKYI